MRLHGAEIVGTFAEAFPMWGARVVITAATPGWALEAGAGELLRVAAPYDDAIDDVLRDRFEERYSVQFDSYPVSEPWLLEPARRVPARPTS